MSRYMQINEMVWDLRETFAQRQRRRAKLVVVYALVDSRGWDARKLNMPLGELRVVWQALKETHARQQEADHSGSGLARHVPGRATAEVSHRVAAGSA